MNKTNQTQPANDAKAIGCNCTDCRCVECRCGSNGNCRCPTETQAG